MPEIASARGNCLVGCYDADGFLIIASAHVGAAADSGTTTTAAIDDNDDRHGHV